MSLLSSFSSPASNLPPQAAKPAYFKQMDALRAIAVAFVLLHHYLPTWKMLHGLALGPAAVRLFFVISGFLITGILLRERQRWEKERSEQLAYGTALAAVEDAVPWDVEGARSHPPLTAKPTPPISLGSLLKTFYARRALRIFPPYYALLAVAFLANTDGAREQIGWHLTYTTNIFLGLQGDWAGYLTPMWSLAVEEQFYLIWPLLMLRLPRPWLKPSIVLTIAVAPLSRWLILHADLSPIWMVTSLVTNLDTLGIGALLALLNAERNQRERRNNSEIRRPRQYWFCNWGLWVGAPLFLMCRGAKLAQQSTDLTASLEYLALAGCFAWVVQGAVRGFGGWAGRLLEAKPLLALGKLSYGIYLYHMIVIDLAFRVLGLPQPASLLVRVPVYSGLTLVAALVSWYGLERPMLQLKRRWLYDPQPVDIRLQVKPFQRKSQVESDDDAGSLNSVPVEMPVYEEPIQDTLSQGIVTQETTPQDATTPKGQRSEAAE